MYNWLWLRTKLIEEAGMMRILNQSLKLIKLEKMFKMVWTSMGVDRENPIVVQLGNVQIIYKLVRDCPKPA